MTAMVTDRLWLGSVMLAAVTVYVPGFTGAVKMTGTWL